MKTIVAERGGTLDFDVHTRNHVFDAAGWLTDANGKPGLLLCGYVGNGKTSLAKAIASLVGFISERELGPSKRIKMPFYAAKDICKLCAGAERYKQDYDEYKALFSSEFLIIDDLGEEPVEVMVFGMPHTPLVDLLGKRYDKRLMTVITTNLGVSKLREKYGERIYDRLKEMVHVIAFENGSYRK